MNRLIALFCALSLFLLCSCSDAYIPAGSEVSFDPSETLQEEPEQVASASYAAEATVRVPGTPGIYATLNRGNVVNILSENGDYYLVHGKVGDGYVNKAYIAMGETLPEGVTAYAGKNAYFYPDAAMREEPLCKLFENDPVTLLADLGDRSLIRFSTLEGYVASSCLKDHSDASDSGGGAKTPQQSGGSGSSSHNSSDGRDIELEPAQKPSSDGAGQDGGDIVFSACSDTGFRVVPLLEAGQSNKGVILADTGLILTFFNFGDSILLEDVGDTVCTAFWEDELITIDRSFLHLTSDTICLSRAIVVPSGTLLYTDYLMNHPSSLTPDTDTSLTVLWELENCYVVSGLGALPLFLPIEASPAESENTPPTTEKKSSGSSGSKASSSESDAPSTPSADPEWTDPVLFERVYILL